MKYLRTILVAAVCVYFFYYAKTYTEWHFIDYVNLIFHEAGHTIFFFFGQFLQILAGSALQLGIPIFITAYFLFSNQIISSTISLLWVGQNLFNISVYAGDAQKMQLELLGGGSVTHDWNYLLNTTGTLSHTPQISSIIYSIGLITIFCGTMLSLYFSLTKATISD